MDCKYKKGDIVRYYDKRAKVIGATLKGNKPTYKIKMFDKFNTIACNVSEIDITRERQQEV